MQIYTNIIDIIINRITEERNKDKIDAYMDVAQIMLVMCPWLRDKLEQEYKKNTENNNTTPMDGKSAAKTEI